MFFYRTAFVTVLLLGAAVDWFTVGGMEKTVTAEAGETASHIDETSKIAERDGVCLGKLVVRKDKKINLWGAYTEEARNRGLSGVFPDEFATDEAMLFYYNKTDERAFWMPNTYMNLDIFFLDRERRVVRVVRGVPAHPGEEEPPPIPRVGETRCRYVLEMRADSDVAEEIEEGMKLRWIVQPPIGERRER